MSDSGPPTSRLCPACGLTSEGRPACRVCDGTGLATPEQVAAWIARQKVRATSSHTRSVPIQVREAIAGLRRRRTMAALAMVAVGEGLLVRLDAGEISAELAERVTDWLTAANAQISGDRS